jgi:tetratricopeptide (TPR) repeat protein
MPRCLLLSALLLAACGARPIPEDVPHARVLAGLEAELGAGSPELAAAVHDLALAQVLRGDPQAAGAFLAEALAILERGRGPDDPALLPLLDAQGRIQLAQRQWLAAAATQDRLLELTEPAQRARVLHGLVGLTAEAGDRQRALALNRRLVAELERTLPADDPNLAQARRNGEALAR